MSEKVDVSKLREGDVVLVQGEYAGLTETSFATTYKVKFGLGCTLNFTSEQIVSVAPRPFRVGDAVVTIGVGHPAYEVQAIVKDYVVLLSHGGGTPFLCNVQQLIPA